jgi:peptide/nickel transport system substrate-binding protein
VTVASAILLVSGIVAYMVLAVAPPASADGGSSPPAKAVLNVGWNQNLDSLNPFVGYQNVSWLVYLLNYDRLVRYDPKTLQPVPGLAERWKHSQDGKVWTFFIRKGVKWQDGEPVTAEDVAFTFNYIIEGNLSNYTLYTPYITSVTAVDPYTVRFELSRPRATMLQMWVPIVPKHIWGSVSPKKAGSVHSNDPPVIGSGPFQVVDWKKNQYVRLVANKDFWGGAPAVDEIIFRTYTNTDTLAADLQKGALDMSAAVDAAQFRRFQDKTGWGAQKATEDAFDELAFNCYEGPSLGNPALRDPRFRRALASAIDTEQIARIAYIGAAEPATSILPTGFWRAPLDYHWDPPEGVEYSYDPKRAAKELDAAGYRDTNGDGVRECNGKPIRLRLWAVQEKPAYASAGKLIAGQLESIGLDVDLATYDDGTLSDHIYNTEGDTYKPDFDLFIWGWGGDFDPNFLLSVMLTSQINGWSDCAWSSKQYDAVYNEQEGTLDPRRRLALVHRMQAIIYAECPYVPLVYPQQLEVYNTARWDGWVLQPEHTGTVDNYWTYLRVAPREGVEAADTNTVLYVWVGIAAVAVIGAGAGAIVWTRRRHGQRLEESD